MDKYTNNKELNFETISRHSTCSILNTDVQQGLSDDEVKKRQEFYGLNKLKETKKKSIIKIFFEQFNNPMVFVLYGAVILTLMISIYETVKTINSGQPFNFYTTGDWPDIIIIQIVLIINSIIGTVQEVKAQTSLDSLKKMSSPEALVLRNGKRIKIKAEELVPGDIVYLEEGDTISADLRLLEAYNFKTNEASLTGESLPVLKKANITFNKKVGVGDCINLAYSSTIVSYGRAVGVVVKTGMDTEIGKIAEALDNQYKIETPLQIKLAKLSKSLGLLTLAIIAVVLIVDIIWIFIHGQHLQIDAYIEAILSSIALAVAAIPEGLPAVVTIVLSIGVQKMVKANTIIRKLPSVETLGSVSVVCSDKTGTLTQNKMTVVKAYIDNKIYEENQITDVSNESIKFLAQGLSLCSNAVHDEEIFGDPTEIALVVFANNLNLHKKMLEEKYPRINEFPFDSDRKMMSTVHQDKDKKITFTKGAVDKILEKCSFILDHGIVREISKNDIDNILNINYKFSSQALRVLALTYSENENLDEKNLIFVGLVAMIDPARKEARPAVESLRRGGVITVMITGDHKDTAFAIAKDLTIADNIDQCIEGKDIDNLTFEELCEVCKKVRVFARVSPQNKVDIVKAFEKNDNICAMTGDGVNDAPSLQAANIGIAMGITGTDVAKDAADMVLTNDNFASIQLAVEEGRGIYENIKKTILFLLSSNIAEVLTMLFIICIGFPSPLIAIHLLWVNLVTDSLPAVALGMDAKNADIMYQKPRQSNETLFSHGGYKITFGYGFVITVSTLLAFFSTAWLNNCFTYQAIINLYNNQEFLLHAQTMAFTTLALSELFHMIGMSDVNKSLFSILKKKNKMMLFAFIIGFILQMIVIEIPFCQQLFSTRNLNLNEWIITGLLSITPLLVHELFVLVSYTKKRKNNK
ncbi:MAG: cation-translocating P-type ATPase [Bacillales bacterium]